MRATGARLEREAKRVLVADDSETYRAVACRVLADSGYRVVAAADGAEAWRILGEGPFDLLIAELNLARIRGLDLLRRVRETPALKGLQVLVVTESLTAHLHRVLGELGLKATLTKNHALRELLYQVDALLLPRDADEREAPRRLHRLPVNYWVAGELRLQSCFDLSEVGMFVVTADEDPPPVGTVLALRFWLPTGDRLIACEGEVVWHNTVAGDLRTTHPPGMGVRFRSLDEADRALLREFTEQAR